MALTFYNQGQPRTTAANGANYNPASSTVQQPRAPTSGYGKFGGLTTDQLRDPETGFGVTFQANAKKAGIEGLKGAQTTENPDDAAAQGELRDYYRQSLGGLGQLGDRRGTAYDTSAQRGLNNMLQQYQRSNAGTGRLGMPQGNRAQSDITQKLAEEYTKGVNDLQGQTLGQAGQIQNGLNGVYNQDLQERNFQNQQAAKLSDYILQQQQLDQSRDIGMEAANQARSAQNSSMWGDTLGTLAKIGLTLGTGGAAAPLLMMPSGGGGSGGAGYAAPALNTMPTNSYGGTTPTIGSGIQGLYQNQQQYSPYAYGYTGN